MQSLPKLETERLILRQFQEEDIEAIFQIYSDVEANTYLPWFPLRTIDEARRLYEEKYGPHSGDDGGYSYAVCLKSDNIPIGYVQISAPDAFDFGYGLRKEFWHEGFMTEACRAVLLQAKADGLPYLTATHDVKNPRSGAVMQKLGMRYQYSYEEQWQPKDFPVTFRLYQMNLDGKEDRVYRKYWEISKVHFVEEILDGENRR